MQVWANGRHPREDRREPQDQNLPAVQKAEVAPVLGKGLQRNERAESNFQTRLQSATDVMQEKPEMKSNSLLANVPVNLLYQALETEKGGVQIYSTALRCAINRDLKEVWSKYLEQTKNHVQIVSDILRELALDPNAETPGRKVVRYIGTSLVKAMELALRCADPQAAQIVAAECVVLAETKDHLNWELIGELAKNADAALLRLAYRQVEEEEDEHLYHTTGWTRELWIQALGMPAVLPPPEQVKKVETASDAAQAKKSRVAKAKAKKAGAK